MEPNQQGDAGASQGSAQQQGGEEQLGDGQQPGDGQRGGGQQQGDGQQQGEGDSKQTRPPARSRAPVQVRVLVACEHGKPNDVVTLPFGVARGAYNAGQVDPDEDAVAYALSLKK
jgi:hypothetical protein